MITHKEVEKLKDRIKYLEKVCDKFTYTIVKQNVEILKLKEKLLVLKNQDEWR